ncbi:GntR family transcriptional regulator [Streptomyces sp. NPDC046215]|uniref:GntR family transcriptional regulator n=1 Tax=Streptomyces stramineus TaxID=173861 RepID=A0ABN0ZNT3_9ACTN
MPDSPERTALYRLYDADERLLYVGITSNPKARMAHHATSKPWWSTVITRETEWFDTREAATAAEVSAILAEKPVHNRTHNPVPSPLLALLPVVEHEPLRPRLQQVERDERSAAQRVAADLRALIMSGEIPLGSKLPTTAEFIEQYRISNVTVQRALVILKAEGLAIGKSGAGVFVTSPTPDNFNDPQHHVVTVVGAGDTTPPQQVAEVLGVASSDRVWREVQITSVDAWPIRMTTAYRCSNAAVVGVEGTDQLTVRVPTTAELITLNLPDEVPVMRTFRIVRGENGKPVEVQIVIEPGHLCQQRYGALDRGRL